MRYYIEVQRADGTFWRTGYEVTFAAALERAQDWKRGDRSRKVGIRAVSA